MKASDVVIANGLLKAIEKIDDQIDALVAGNLNGAQLNFGISTACDCPNIFRDVPPLQLNFNHGSEVWDIVQNLANAVLRQQRLEIVELLRDMGVVVDA